MSVQVIRGDSFQVFFTPTYLEAADLVIADPPYGGIVKDKDWEDEEVYQELTQLLLNVMKPGATAYVWGGIGRPNHRPFLRWLSEVEQSGLTLHNLITWSKKRAYGKKDNYLFTREECAMLVKGEKPKTFNIPLLAEKRGYPGYNLKYPAKSEYKRRTNVWTDITEIFRGKIHQCQKPTRLAEIMIETSSNPGEMVIDPFAGSGSTGAAAEKLNRECLLVEQSDCPMLI